MILTIKQYWPLLINIVKYWSLMNNIGQQAEAEVVPSSSSVKFKFLTFS